MNEQRLEQVDREKTLARKYKSNAVRPAERIILGFKRSETGHIRYKRKDNGFARECFLHNRYKLGYIKNQIT